MAPCVMPMGAFRRGGREVEDVVDRPFAHGRLDLTNPDTELTISGP